MREDISDSSVDLIYLDPPFNSKRLYNAFIGDAQWVAFNDTWRWSEAVNDFHDVAKEVRLAKTMEGLRMILGEGPNLAYLAYMANRLRECARVLKPTGSIYLHCDQTMSHYLKVVLDCIFNRKNFRNEIVWSYNRFSRRGDTFARMNDTIFFYSLSNRYFFVKPEGVARNTDRYKKGYHTVSDRGVSKLLVYDIEKAKHKIESAKAMGREIKYTKAQRPTMGNVWTDIPIINPQSSERTGYPTQKPLALLQRIIEASCPPDGIVLDPFCGCGTTIHAAANLQRKWIGIDVCVNACKVIEKRLRGHFDSVWNNVEFIGMPMTQNDAKTLASLDSFRFERWAASLVDGMEHNKIQRGDGGIDGRGRFAIRKGKFIDIVSQVKGGGTGPGDIQAFNGARQQAGADLGIFTCFEDRVTQKMRDAAASTGRFMETPIIQIYTIEDYFNDRRPSMPRVA